MPTPQDKERNELLAVQGIQAELARWEHLVFSFDMDKNDQNSLENAKGQNQRQTPPTPTPGPQSDVACVAGSSSSIEQALSQLLNPSSYPLAHNPLGLSSDLFNSGQAFSQFVPEYYPLPDTPISPLIAYADPQLGVNREESSASPVSHLPPLLAPSSSSMTANTDTGEAAEFVAITEEKRRRNTAASARFRIKKKQRTVHLERSVSDLKGRAEELEKEVADLRRENSWLKEIVILKGSQHVAAQRQLAQRLFAQNAGVILPSGDRGQGNESLGIASSSSTKEATIPEETSSDDSELEKPGGGAKNQ